MKKIILGIFLVSFSFNLYAQNIQNEQFLFSQLVIKLDFPDTIPLVIQVAIFKENPLEIYDSIITQNKESILSKLKEITDSNMVKRQIISAQTYFWDKVFNSVTGYDMILLTSRPEEAISFSITDPIGTFYVVTKICIFREFFCCWCIPVQLKAGQETTVVLNKMNYLNLKGLFNYIMNKNPESL